MFFSFFRTKKSTLKFFLHDHHVVLILGVRFGVMLRLREVEVGGSCIGDWCRLLEFVPKVDAHIGAFVGNSFLCVAVARAYFHRAILMMFASNYCFQNLGLQGARHALFLLQSCGSDLYMFGFGSCNICATNTMHYCYSNNAKGYCGRQPTPQCYSFHGFHLPLMVDVISKNMCRHIVKKSVAQLGAHHETQNLWVHPKRKRAWA